MRVNFRSYFRSFRFTERSFIVVIFFAVLFFYASTVLFSAYGKQRDRRHDIEKLPPGFIEIQALTKVQKQKAIELLKRSGISIEDTFGRELTDVYVGDFSNEGLVEYAFVTTGGTANVNTVTVYKLIDGRMDNANLDSIIVANLLPPKSDMSQFHFFIADPFAIKNLKTGKIYLRFITQSFDHRDFVSPRFLCTYRWEKDRFKLTGPNFSEDSKGRIKKLISCL